MNKKGFTLIELLVVIAIIGILSSIAIVYLSDARKKANDAKVSSNVTTASTQIELDRANGGTVAAATVTAVTNKLGSHPCGGSWTPIADGTYANVAIYSALCTDTAQVFCADSNGFRGTTTAAAVTTLNNGKCQ